MRVLSFKAVSLLIFGDALATRLVLERLDLAVAICIRPPLHEPATAAQRNLDVHGFMLLIGQRRNHQGILLLGTLLSSSQPPQTLKISRRMFLDKHAWPS